MEFQVIKKAWKVWVDNDSFNDYPYFGNIEDLPCVYGDTASEAKGRCEFDYDNWTEIRCRRSKSEDRVLYKGWENTRGSVMYSLNLDKEKQSKVKTIKKFPENSMFYVQRHSNGYVGNSILLWKIEGKGYTINPDNAQKYTRQEIIDDFIFKGSDEIFWEANHFESKISKHVDSQHLSVDYRV